MRLKKDFIHVYKNKRADKKKRKVKKGERMVFIYIKLYLIVAVSILLFEQGLNLTVYSITLRISLELRQTNEVPSTHVTRS